MDFNDFIKFIPKLSTTPLGGLETQFKLAPKIRKPYSKELLESNNSKKAAVLALFYPNEFGKTSFLLTLRANYNGTHSSQISFPGGKFDEKDTTLINTALRETFEEVGVKIGNHAVFKQMTNVYIPPSNFLVTPFLACLNNKPTFVKNHEVAALIEVSLSDFLNKSSISSTTLSTSYAKNMVVPCFKLNDYIVWGATAMMLSEIRELLEKV